MEKDNSQIRLAKNILESHGYKVVEGIRDKVPSKEYLMKNPDASKEPARDALKVNVRSLEKEILNLKKYIEDTPQRAMTVKDINEFLRFIDEDIQTIRKYIGVTRSKNTLN